MAAPKRSVNILKADKGKRKESERRGDQHLGIILVHGDLFQEVQGPRREIMEKKKFNLGGPTRRG